MTSDELVEALESAPDESLGAEALKEEVERFFVFSVGESKYALSPTAIHEIVTDLEVFPLPACPPYVSGLINCHGKPYTVFDLRVLFESERQAATQFLIMNLKDDDVAFGCTEVDEIAEVPVSDISTFADEDAESRFCTSLLNLEGRRVPVLSIALIQKQLETDLA